MKHLYGPFFYTHLTHLNINSFSMFLVNVSLKYSGPDQDKVIWLAIDYDLRSDSCTFPLFPFFYD